MQGNEAAPAAAAAAAAAPTAMAAMAMAPAPVSAPPPGLATATTAAPAAAPPAMTGERDQIYAVKRTRFLGKPVTYVCQNINGPCPLLAISNVLLLRGHISVDWAVQNGGWLYARDLLQIVRKRLEDANPPLVGSAVNSELAQLTQLTQQKTLQDVKELLPHLLVGLDVNVRFHSITAFEYTVECAVFDMLDIALVHGWLLDLQDERTVNVIQDKSYNQLIERLVDYRGVLMTEQGQQEQQGVEGASAETVEGALVEPTEAATPSDDVAHINAEVPTTHNIQGSEAAVQDGESNEVSAAKDTLEETSRSPATEDQPSHESVTPSNTPTVQSQPEANSTETPSETIEQQGESLEEEKPAEVLPPTDSASAAPTSTAPPSEQSDRPQIDVGLLEATSPTAQSPSRGEVSPSKRTVQTLQQERHLTEADAETTAAALLEEGPVLEEFFATTASQLTYFGLTKLHEELRERQLCVFFRNNHFSTLFKYQGELYLLVTDAGYLDEPSVVWERLNEIDGDTEYLNDQFLPLDASVTQQQRLLSQQEQARRAQEAETSAPTPNDASENTTDDEHTPSQSEANAFVEDPDYLLAMRLQQEEEEVHARAQEAMRLADQSVNRYPVDQRPPTSAPQRITERDYVNANSYNSSANDPDDVQFDAFGQPILSAAEMEEQRKAAFFYQQQQQRRGVNATPAYPGPRSTPPSQRHQQQNDCAIM